MLYSTTKIAKQKGVTSQTIRRWIKDGRYEFEITHGGHYRIKQDVTLEIILYARVSSSKQKSSIETQKRLLKERYGNEKFMFDIGSGFNFKRRNFIKILEQVLSGNPVKLISTTPDRISRSGLTFIKKVIEFYGGEVLFLEDNNQTESFDVATLISFLTSFCNSQSGKRNNRNKKNKDLPKEQKSNL